MLLRKVVVLILATGLTSAKSEPEEFDSYFLTHEQFVSLPREKRSQWLREIQSVLSEMAENSDFMAYETLFADSKKRSPAQFVEASEDLKKLRAERRREFLKSQGITISEYQKIHQRVVSTPLNRRNSPEYQRDYATWRAAMNYVNQKEAEDRARQRSPDEANQRSQQAREEAEKQAEQQAWVEKNKAAHEKFLAEQRLSKQERRALRAQEQKESERQQRLNQIQNEFRVSEIQNLNATTPREEDLCLFAGWIVNGRPCVGPRSMPDDIKFKGIDNEQLRCETGTYLCNPLLFGVVAPRTCKSLYFHYGQGDSPCLKQVKPLCVGFSGGAPTRECTRLSSKTVDYAVELIGENDPRLFREFRSRFHNLCHESFLQENEKIAAQKNASRLRSDVQRTCNVAKMRLEEVKDKFEKFIPRPPLARPGSPGGEGQR